MANITSHLIESCLQQPRWWGTQDRLPNGEYLISGGNVTDASVPAGERAIDTIEIVDPATCKSRKLAFHLEAPLRGTSAVLTSSQAFIFGGGPSTVIHQLDLRLADGVKPSQGNMLQPRSGSAQMQLIDGRILITGGYNSAPNAKGVLKTAEYFAPASLQSVALKPMNFERAGHTLTQLGNGLILVAGGQSAAGETAEIFIPQENAFKVLDSKLHAGRKDHRAIRDSEGLVWFIGGTGADGKSIASIEYFDPVLKKFVNAFDSHGRPLALSEGREDLDAVFLQSAGLIVVVGGEAKGIPGNPASNKIDVIDLANRRVFSADLKTPRDEATIAVQSVNPKGAVLVLLQGMNQKKPVPAERVTITW